MHRRGVDGRAVRLPEARGTPLDRSGDPVDLHDHALQTAALLRRSRPSDKELQVAGLVHDLGHLLSPGDDAGHADRAAEAVRGLLGERVARLVRLHVPAKRYLAAVEPGRGLSAQSSLTLGAQGGPMTAREVAAFEADPLAEDAVTLRQADDAGKVVGLDAGSVERLAGRGRAGGAEGCRCAERCRREGWCREGWCREGWCREGLLPECGPVGAGRAVSRAPGRHALRAASPRGGRLREAHAFQGRGELREQPRRNPRTRSIRGTADAQGRGNCATSHDAPAVRDESSAWQTQSASQRRGAVS
ncbi:HD domain-containing protein [Streptomyces sp. KL116D]|uniref:HD domain-containing protein n=1 Tax=Streptomyces sp. KL116D TaxID=3045152 RepID=UPI003558ECBD